MDKSEAIIQYLVDKYHPTVLISYGSFADGTASTNSDYDALLVYDGPECHDGSIVEETPLDVFCYPLDKFTDNYNPEDYLGVLDSKIVIDSNGLGQSIKKKVLEFVNAAPKKTEAELQHEIEWCKKMFARSLRGDAEGYFRWHWVLVDSLEIYCNIIGKYYYGPKKTLRYLKEIDREGYAYYEAAMKEFSSSSLKMWIDYLEMVFQEK